MSTYHYFFEKNKKLSENVTRMANVTVWDAKGKQIGRETVSSWQKPTDMVDMIVRDHEISKIWNKKQKQ